METSKLICKECNFENEPERVYCHNCGVKLDRSVLPALKSSEPSNRVKHATARRIRRMSPGSTAFGAADFILAFVKCIFYALLVSMVIQIFRPPSNIPNSELTGEQPDILSELESDAQNRSPMTRVYTEDGINEYLRTRVKSKSEGTLSEILVFNRIYGSLFKDGVCRLTIDQSIVNYHYYISADYRIEKRNGDQYARIVGGSIGRLPIHPSLMQSTRFFFDKVWNVFKRELELLTKWKQITVGEKKVTVVSNLVQS